MISRCPHCRVVYKVSEFDLNKAEGAVRCSSCMKIFNALNHRVQNFDLNSDLNRVGESENYRSQQKHSSSASRFFDADISTGAYDENWQENAKNKKTYDKFVGKNTKNGYNLHQNETERTSGGFYNQNSTKRQSIFNKLKFKIKYIFFALTTFVVIFLAVLAFKFFLISQEKNSGFKISNIVLLPAESLKEFKVEFEIENLNLKASRLPSLKFEMQDLSKNTIKTQNMSSDLFAGDLSIIASKQKRKLIATLKRPKKLVAGVKITLVDDLEK